MDCLHCNLELARGDFNLKVALDLPLNGVTAIFGQSGSGKTTFLRCLAGLEKIEKGKIQIGSTTWFSKNELSTSEVEIPTYLRDIGYVFQESNLLSHLSVKENIRYGMQRRKKPLGDEELRQVIEVLDIEPLMSRYPDNLSGGEKQRVAIARAIARNPKLLLMDEPLASLDQRRKLEFLHYLEKLLPLLNIPAVYVSHSAQEVTRLANYLVLLENGHILAHGNLVDILRQNQNMIFQQSESFSLLFGKINELDKKSRLLIVDLGSENIRLPLHEEVLDSLQEKQDIRLQVMAKDVSVTLKRASESSILNIFECEILNYEHLEREGQTLLTLKLCEHQLQAKVSRYSFEELQLRSITRVFAQVKAASVVR
ncbi:molybdenum ABC transporter ATP-binding protein [Aliikangiella sp. G2MR2-5]|uniref:molybdenum ABC transporter ATP-binding protein n=1 Tax=Aliikangiella sp. G2MR2-5 TaxID=2788943 RepID=UPI0018ABC49C|nr:molybdenum ABC transporter ATP-binding protein [Aliikangiella sp. G2MR2-5]